MEELTGKTLGPYEVKEKIGQGGMAHVFKAYQPALDRFVAIKILSPHLADTPRFTERFQREARAIARLNHPNILQVYDFGVQDNYHYIVMRYVENSVTLATLMKQGRPVAKLIDYTLQVANALNYAHQRGIIHRDVKPSNILIDDQWALLSDFGLVKEVESNKHLTAIGRGGIGTPAYMSPEQAKGDKIDHRTDIYALGIILYEILTGQVPHDTLSPMAMVAKRITEPVPPPSLVNPRVSKDLERVALRALVREPGHRYSSATEFARSLQTAKNDAIYYEENPLATPVVPELLLPSGPTEPKNPLLTTELQTVPHLTQSKNSRLLISGAVVALILLAFMLSSLNGSNNQVIQATATFGDSNQIKTTPVIAQSTATATPPADTSTPILAGIPNAVVKTELEVWSGPGNNYELLGYLPSGAKAEIISRDQRGAWWQIKTSLSSTGVGWIKADKNSTEVANTDNIPIALAPATSTTLPTPTPLATATPSHPPVTEQATPTTPPTPTLISGEWLLLKPVSLEEPSFGPTEFEWQWQGILAENQGFEVRVWRDGEPSAGVHNAILDNKNGTVQPLDHNTYRLLTDITTAPGVHSRRGEYNWTVALVQIEPEYRDLGFQAPVGRLRFEPPGSGGNGGSSGGGLTGGD